MGNTGNSTTPHTHVEIREIRNGVIVRRLNPADYMGIPNKLGTYNSKDFQIIETRYLANKNYKGGSITEALKQIGVDSSFAYRKKLAELNGITNYKGTATQNTQLLDLLKKGRLRY